MNTTAFLALCTSRGYSSEQKGIFGRAITVANSVLHDKERLAGDTFFDHNLRVAAILAENKSDPDIVTTGILNGVLKYTGSASIVDQFGKPIVELLHGVEDISAIKSKNPQLEADSLRKILLTTLKDVRVIIVKLASKVENLRTISSLPGRQQKKIAQDVLDIYAPLAMRLGLDKIRVQLEDLAFSVLHPKKYGEIRNYIEESREQRERNVEEACTLISSLAKGKATILKIKGRPKHIYSIFKKMKIRGVKLDQQYDLLGIRIIVKSVKDCYTLLGLLHQHFQPIQGRLKDYIANPKSNFYQSLHTGVLLPGTKRLEIQIRTPEMDELAEEGIAAHWRYKGLKSDVLFERKMAWLKGVLDLQKSGESKEFLETVKVDLFGDKIHCYTPKGDVKELPKDATLLDFAFSIHEDIGSHAVGGRVNGKFVPIKKKLEAGDIVEIITNKNQRPRRSWIKIVTSSKSRQRIRKALKQYESLPAFYYRRLKPVVKEELGLLVESEEFPNAMCILAKCCKPLPGSEIVGILTKKRIISSHSQTCRHVEKEQNRWVPVQWKNSFNQQIQFCVEAGERSGLLADLLHTIAQAGFEIKEAKAKLLDSYNAQCSFTVIPRDLEQLQEMVGRVKKVKGVKKMYFE